MVLPGFLIGLYLVSKPIHNMLSTNESSSINIKTNRTEFNSKISSTNNGPERKWRLKGSSWCEGLAFWRLSNCSHALHFQQKKLPPQ